MVSVSISFRLSEEERQTVETLAEMLGVSISDVVRDAIREYVAKITEDEELREKIQKMAIWRKYREETKDVLRAKLWYWNAYKMIDRLRKEGVPEETVKEIVKEIGTRMEDYDPEQAKKFKRLIMGRVRR